MRNGVDKTTTVRILSTLIAQTSGSASVAGIPVGRDGAAEIRQRIAVMPEAARLYQRLTVAENLEYFAAVRPAAAAGADHGGAGSGWPVRPGARPDRAAVQGLKQRASLARSLLNDPAVLFLDEPTSGLDPVASHEVHGLIAGMRDRGATVFLTTHRLEEAERLCDRVAIMSTSLRSIGRPDDLRRELFTASLEVMVGPTAEILTLQASTASATLDKRVDYALFLPLMVSVLVPAMLSAYSVVGERDQGTLEPVLTSPVS